MARWNIFAIELTALAIGIGISAGVLSLILVNGSSSLPVAFRELFVAEILVHNCRLSR